MCCYVRPCFLDLNNSLNPNPKMEQQSLTNDPQVILEKPTGTEVVHVAEPVNQAVMPGFNSRDNWELAQRIGKAFATSTLVPAQFKDNVANCIIALEMANRMGASPLMVMQNLYIVHGNPGWSSKFLIASFNQCGRFSSLRYEWNEERTSCRAWATEKSTGERIDGPTITMDIAKKEGWSTKNGSKWQTMPELMLMYRAAAFLIRTYAPEISMGLQTTEELVDIAPPTVKLVPSLPRLTPGQFTQAKEEIRHKVTTVALIKERFMITPEFEAELTAIEDAA